MPFIDLVKAPLLKRCGECNTRLVNAQHYWMNTVEQAFSSYGVSQQLEQDLYKNFQLLQMPPDLGQRVVQRLKYLRMLSELRWGNVPVIHIDIHIDSDEIPHFSIPSTYHKQNKQIRLLLRSARVKEEQDAHKKWPAKQTTMVAFVGLVCGNTPESGLPAIPAICSLR